ncbi:MAG: bacillithiol biosynthesis deacetylase BshB1, partial [Planctomycetota bacterium]
DDAEMAAGGLIAKMVSRGHSVGIVDLTRGEMGTRGTPEQRTRESAAADEVLGISVRENLGLPDGGLTDSLENRRLVVDAIRRHRPTLVVAPPIEDLHPDHAAAGRLVAAAHYPTGFTKYDTGTPPHRPNAVIHMMNHFEFMPTFIVDITDVWETKMAAVACYGSQLHDAGSTEPKTKVSSPEFLAAFEGRYRHYGSMIGATFGEPFWNARPAPVVDPVAAYGGDAR